MDSTPVKFMQNVQSLRGLIVLLAFSAGAGCSEEEGTAIVGCVSDGECAADLRCQPTLGTCHECTNDQHCGAGRYCLSLTCQQDDVDGGLDGSEDMDTADVPADVAVDGDVDDDMGDLPPDTVGDVCDPACPGIQRCNEETERCEERGLCINDLDCVGDRLCFQNACANPNDILGAGGCTDDDSCINQGQLLYCELTSHQCRPQGLCRDSSQCPGALVCTNDGQCVECLSESECTGGLICDDTPGTNRCAEPAVCLSGDDCLGDRECDGEFCAEPSCTDDEFDFGDGSCADAVSLDEGHWDLAICGGDCDWFAIDLDELDGFIARVFHEPANGDLNVELFRGGCQAPESVARSASEESAEVVWVPRSFEDGTYHLRVCPFIREGDGGTNLYALDTVRIPGGFCVDDIYDDNASNDEPEGASTISVDSRPFDFVADGLNVCPGASDWYRIELDAGDFLGVQVDLRHRFGDLELDVYEGRPGEGEVPLASSATEADIEIVQLVASRSAEFYIHVRGANDEVQNEYSLAVDIAQGCVDAFEPQGSANDTRADATALEDLPRDYVGLQLCENDEDWFTVDVPAGMVADFNVTYDENLGLDLLGELRVGTSPAVGYVGAAGRLSMVASGPDGGGELVARLFRDSLDDVVYNLSVELRPEGDRCEDEYDRGNGAFGTAFDAVFGVREYPGRICPNAGNYFAVTVPAGQMMYAELLNVSDPGQLEVDILGLGQEVVGASEVGIHGPRAAFLATAQTEVVVRVTGLEPRSEATYLLQMYSQPEGPGCGDDLLEVFMDAENDEWDQAREVSGGTWLRNLIACPSDLDWYKFFVIAGQGISVVIQTHLPDMAAVHAVLWDPEGPEFGLPVRMAPSRNGTLTLDLDGVNVFSGGEWSLEVYTEGAETVFYDMRITTQ
jgi:hypothetical protein